MKNRFFISRSIIYGLTVYDRETNTPAYEAVQKYTTPTVEADGSRLFHDCTQLSEYQAIHLCSKLNNAHKKEMQKNETND